MNPDTVAVNLFPPSGKPNPQRMRTSPDPSISNPMKNKSKDLKIQSIDSDNSILTPSKSSKKLRTKWRKNNFNMRDRNKSTSKGSTLSTGTSKRIRDHSAISTPTTRRTGILFLTIWSLKYQQKTNPEISRMTWKYMKSTTKAPRHHWFRRFHLSLGSVPNEKLKWYHVIYYLIDHPWKSSTIFFILLLYVQARLEILWLQQMKIFIPFVIRWSSTKNNDVLISYNSCCMIESPLR